MNSMMVKGSNDSYDSPGPNGEKVKKKVSKLKFGKSKKLKNITQDDLKKSRGERLE